MRSDVEPVASVIGVPCTDPFVDPHDDLVSVLSAEGRARPVRAGCSRPRVRAEAEVNRLQHPRPPRELAPAAWAGSSGLLAGVDPRAHLRNRQLELRERLGELSRCIASLYFTCKTSASSSRCSSSHIDYVIMPFRSPMIIE